MSPAMLMKRITVNETAFIVNESTAFVSLTLTLTFAEVVLNDGKISDVTVSLGGT